MTLALAAAVKNSKNAVVLICRTTVKQNITKVFCHKIRCYARHPELDSGSINLIQYNQYLHLNLYMKDWFLLLNQFSIAFSNFLIAFLCLKFVVCISMHEKNI